MKKAYSAIKLLIDSWNRLRKTYPNETDFTEFGYDGIEAGDFDDMFPLYSFTL